MGKITHYKMVMEPSASQLEDEAGHLISCGWEPYGFPFAADDPGDSPDFVQCFIKREGEENHDGTE